MSDKDGDYTKEMADLKGVLTRVCDVYEGALCDATTPSSSTEEISRGPATPAPAGRSGETTSGLVSAPGSSVPLCAPNHGAQGPGQPSSAPFAPSAPLAPGFPAPIPPRAHHGGSQPQFGPADGLR